MAFLRNNWYRFTIVAFVAMGYWTLFWGGSLDTIQKLLLASFMTLPLHQFEEYQFPGGGPVVINRYFCHAEGNWRHHPGNWNSTMVVNLSAYVFCILALAFPQLMWLGMATMLFSLYQVLGHGIQMNRAMRTWYNPGMATAIALFQPISIAYMMVAADSGLMDGWGWLFAVLAFLAIALISVVIPVQSLNDEDSPYDVPEWQVEQHEKVKAHTSLGHAE